MKEYINFINFLDTKNKQMLILFVMLMVFTVILEILSISSILPVLHLLSKNEINPFVSKFFLLFTSDNYLLLQLLFISWFIIILLFISFFGRNVLEKLIYLSAKYLPISETIARVNGHRQN